MDYSSLLVAKVALLQRQKAEIATMRLNAENAMKDAQQEANSHIGAMASRYDTFKEEAQYLVEGQKLQLVTLTHQLQQYSELLKLIATHSYKQVALGACITLAREDKRKNFFITPITSHDMLMFSGQQYHAIYYMAPLIKPFMGKKEGEYMDDIDHELADYQVLDIL